LEEAGTSPPTSTAIARYRYMLKTAPPETSERALAEEAHDNPRALARLATRTEIRQPGTISAA